MLVDYLVEAGRWDTTAADRVRHSLYARPAHLPYMLWLNVELTTNLLDRLAASRFERRTGCYDWPEAEG